MKKIILCIILLVTTIFIIFSGCYYFFINHPYPQFIKTTFNALPAWKTEDARSSLIAFKQSCHALLKQNPDLPFNAFPESGKMSDWQLICLAAEQVNLTNPDNARVFFESWFQPYQVKDHFKSTGLFTGYYLPVIRGRLHRNTAYKTPIYGLPDDLVKIPLGLFKPELKNQTAIAQIKNHILSPYPNRISINQGKLSPKTPVLAWALDPVDVFFAQIQGSAIIEIPHHASRLIGYLVTNGQPYTPIGKVLIQQHALKKEEVSMQSIRAWLTHHPDQVNTILNQNASYVFFRLLPGNAPLGTQQVPLTTERSLAVDTHYISLGTPIWLNTHYQAPNQSDNAFNHLMIAQDTGGAISGVIRGDIYWGAGDNAAYIAGHMKNTGQYWVLFPQRIK